MPTITLQNIKHILTNKENPIAKSRVFGSNGKNQYKLLKPVVVELSNLMVLLIPRGYVWDLASAPKILHNIISTDNDAEIAFLIHDYLYENRIESQKFADNEMLKWQRAVNGTQKWSWRNIDNYLRFWAVRLFGKTYWKT